MPQPNGALPEMRRGERTFGAYLAASVGGPGDAKRNPICFPRHNGMRSTGQEVWQWDPERGNYFGIFYARGGPLSFHTAWIERTLRPRALAFVGVAVGSEIRLLRSWNLGVRSRVPLGVFGTDKFRPLIQGAPKRYGRRPGHRESACILNHEFDL